MIEPLSRYRADCADTFGLASLTHSLLTNFDVITNHASQDRINSHRNNSHAPTSLLSASSCNAGP